MSKQIILSKNIQILLNVELKHYVQQLALNTILFCYLRYEALLVFVTTPNK